MIYAMGDLNVPWEELLVSRVWWGVGAKLEGVASAAHVSGGRAAGWRGSGPAGGGTWEVSWWRATGDAYVLEAAVEQLDVVG